MRSSLILMLSFHIISAAALPLRGRTVIGGPFCWLIMTRHRLLYIRTAFKMYSKKPKQTSCIGRFGRFGRFGVRWSRPTTVTLEATTIIFEVPNLTFEARNHQIFLLNTKRPGSIDKYLALVGNAMSGARQKYHSTVLCDIVTEGNASLNMLTVARMMLFCHDHTG